MKIPINASIFHDYDIRGIYPKEINEDTFFTLGRAVAAYLQVPEIAVGFDARLSSLSLFKALTQGIRKQGVDVINLGQISTEIHYFASGFYKFPANIIISASHNPPEYNGMKIVKKGVVPLHGEYGLPEIKKLALEQNFYTSHRQGKIRKIDILDQWIKHALSFIDIKKLRPLKVVIDAGNGMAGISWKKILGVVPCKIIPLYFKPDGCFPHHLPDPLNEENIKDLQAKILLEKADLGFAMDGDADRFFVLDDTGKFVSGTVTSAILSLWLLKKYGPSVILYNAVCGRIVPETIKKFGGTPIRVRVGHSFIKEYMKKNNALFAGEHSGHFYFRENFYGDSSLIAGLLFLEFLSNERKSLSEIVAKIDKYPQSGEINFKTNDAKTIISAIKKKFSNAEKIDEIDGLSVFYNDYWFNLRPSKTEPLLRLNLEADTKEILRDKIKMLEGELFELGAVKNHK